MKNTAFQDCSLKEVDFTEVDLTGSVFQNTELERATFQRSNLEKVDFRTALNYAIDPELNKIKKAKFALSGIAGLLTRHQIVID